MDPEARRRLTHIIQSIDRISEYIAGSVFADYQRETMMRDATERRVLIIGEAINRLYAIDWRLTEQINDYVATIDTRNDLAHEYDREDLASRIWNANSVFHPVLRLEVEDLLSEA